MRTTILSQAQAEAVFSAICALNNVGGRFIGTIKINDIKVTAWSDGDFSVNQVPHEIELHDNQAAFATAYKLT